MKNQGYHNSAFLLDHPSPSIERIIQDFYTARRKISISIAWLGGALWVMSVGLLHSILLLTAVYFPFPKAPRGPSDGNSVRTPTSIQEIDRVAMRLPTYATNELRHGVACDVSSVSSGGDGSGMSPADLRVEKLKVEGEIGRVCAKLERMRKRRWLIRREVAISMG